MVENLRGSYYSADSLSGGNPKLRGSLGTLEVVSGGNPNIRGIYYTLDVISGGNPKLRAGLVTLEVLTVIPENPWAAMLIFPTLRGRSWSTHKNPTFSTRMSAQQSGQEVRSASYQYPKWEFDLTYDWLSNVAQPGALASDLNVMRDLFLQCQGSYQYFLYRDYRPTSPGDSDYQVRNGYIGLGDAVTLQFPFSRQFVPWQSVAEPGGFIEPVGQVDFSTIATFLPSAINTGTSQIALAGLATGAGPYFVAETGGSIPAGLAANTPYWVIEIDPTHIRLASSLPNALAGTYVPITGAGSGSLSLTKGFAVYEQIAEAHSVPGSPAYTITASHAAAFIADGGVTLAGAPLVAVAGSPGPGQYAVNTATGVYTFNAAQVSASVVITYTYIIAPSAYSILMPNQLLFVAAPAASSVIFADFDFYFVCRFLDDVMDFENFASTFWNLQKCNFISVPTNPAP